MKKYERFFDDLTMEELNYLKTIKKPKDLKSIDVIDDWEDDHEICLGVKINGKVEVGFWWAGFDFAKDILRMKNKKDIVECIQHLVADAIYEVKQREHAQKVLDTRLALENVKEIKIAHPAKLVQGLFGKYEQTGRGLLTLDDGTETGKLFGFNFSVKLSPYVQKLARVKNKTRCKKEWGIVVRSIRKSLIS